MSERANEQAAQAAADDRHPQVPGAQPGRRAWFPPVLEDIELAMEVTAYAGRN